MKENWIIPCNVKAFDIIEHFKTSDTVCWRRGGKEVVGDDVYIYVGTPYQIVKFKCTVLDDCVSKEEMKNHDYATRGGYYGDRFMKLKKIYTFDKPIPLSELQNRGVYRVRKQSRIDRKLLEYFTSIETANVEEKHG